MRSQGKKFHFKPMLGMMTLHAHSATFIKPLGSLGGSGEFYLVGTQITVSMAGSLVERATNFTTPPRSVNKQPNNRTNAPLRCGARDETDNFITNKGGDENIAPMLQPRNHAIRRPC